MKRASSFTIPRESTSPARSMARELNRNKVPRMDDMRFDDIRPMVWSAQVIAPAADANVTILMRVSYRSLEEICGALLESRDAVHAAARLS
jgi:hypothetical protein